MNAGTIPNRHDARVLRWAVFTLAVVNPLACSDAFFDSFNLPKVTAGVLMAAGVAFWLTWTGWKRGGLAFPQSPALALFAASWLWMGLLLPVGLNPADGVVEWIRYGSYLAFLPAVMIGLDSLGAVKGLFRTLAGIGGVLSAYGLAQYLGLPFARIEASFEAISTFGHQNFAAEALLFFLPAAAYLILFEKSPVLKVCWGLSLALMGLHLLVTQCRASWLGAVFTTGVSLALMGAVTIRSRSQESGKILKHLGMAALAVAVVGGVLLVATPFGTRFLSSFNPQEGTARMRLDAWKSTLRMVAEHPLLGVGPGNYKQNIPWFRDPEEREFSGIHSILNKAHNEYLETLSEQGPVGFLLLLGLMGLGWLNAWKALERRSGPGGREAVLVAFWAMAASQVNAFFAFNFSNGTSGLLFWMSWGLLAAMALPGWGEEKALTTTGKEKVQSSSDKKKKEAKKQRHSWEEKPAVTAILALPFRVINRPVLYLLLAGWAVFGSVWQIRQTVADVLLQRGKQAEVRKNWPQAAYWYGRSTSWYPYQYMAFYYYGFSLGNMGRTQEAVAITQRCLDLNPSYRNAAFNLGVLQEHLGHPDAALDAYRKALELDPRFYSALNNVNVIYQTRGDYNAAIATVKRALRYYPHSPDAHSNLGVIYYLTGDYNLAVAEFQEALGEQWRIHFQPTDVNYFERVGAVEGRVAARDAGGRIIGQWSGWGIFHFSSDPARPPEIKNPLNLFRLLHDPATNAYSIEFDPVQGVQSWVIEYRIRGNTSSYTYNAHDLVYAKALNNLGATYEKKERFDLAERYYREALAYEPAYSTPYAQLAKLYINQLHRYEEAVPLIRKYLELEPKSGRSDEFRRILAEMEGAK